jgi:hypothetical protein
MQTGVGQIVRSWIGDRVPSTTMQGWAYSDQVQDHLFLRKAVQPSEHPIRLDYRMTPVTTPNPHL